MEDTPGPLPLVVSAPPASSSSASNTVVSGAAEPADAIEVVDATLLHDSSRKRRRSFSKPKASWHQLHWTAVGEDRKCNYCSVVMSAVLNWIYI